MRKLEYLVADALAQGCDTLVSIGGVQSNHTRQVAGVAAHLGLKCVLGAGELGRLARRRLRQGRQHPAHPDHGRRRAARSRPASASASRRAGSRRCESVEASRRQAVRRSPPAPPTTRSAGSASPTGRARSPSRKRELGVFFDTIVVCSVTGSTQAGMIAGLRARRTRRPRAVIGIDALGDARRRRATRSPASPATPPTLIGLGRDLRDDEISSTTATHAGTYGIPDEHDDRRDPARRPTEGMLTDPVYEGKSMAGLIDLVRRGRDRARLDACSTPTSAASRRSTPTPAPSERPEAPGGGEIRQCGDGITAMQRMRRCMRPRTFVGSADQPQCKEHSDEDLHHRARDPRRQPADRRRAARDHHASPTTRSRRSSSPTRGCHSYVAGDKIYCVHQAESAEDDPRARAAAAASRPTSSPRSRAVFDSTGPRELPGLTDGPSGRSDSRRMTRERPDRP